MSNTQGTAARVALAAGGDAKVPRTERGRRTLRKLLDAAAEEFGEKGFHEASVSSITRRAAVALGSFYTYFDSKDALFRALVADMSEKVRTSARSALTENMGALEIERAALVAFLHFAAEHKEIYRIIDEAEFVDPASYRQHYETIAARIADRLRAGGAGGEFREGLGELEAWAVMGMNVFVGLRYIVWGAGEGGEAGEAGLSPEQAAAGVNRLLAEGVLRR
jgi:AcrR family transcriptional regulator